MKPKDRREALWPAFQYATCKQCKSSEFIACMPQTTDFCKDLTPLDI